MNQKNSRNGRRQKIILSILSVMIILFLACGIYLNDYYHADMDAIETFTVEYSVEMRSDAEGNLVFEPERATAGFIFYPGGKVEYTAYIPLMKALASEGILGVLVDMPFHLAVLDIDAAEGIREQYPQIEHWYIGGHSLGGSMAAAYLAEEADDFEGLILLGSYSETDLSETDLSVVSIYGSEDLVMNREKYEENKANLPEEFSEVILDGGCHAYFGMYGAQEGDGTPEISNEEQIALTVDAISEMVLDVQ
ncbi:MAG: alpha/beta hydrolase [Lachnospiraceae bacterium]|nr:alpha/beta hydrolase [Lachnospiraceae bacterium]